MRGYDQWTEDTFQALLIMVSNLMLINNTEWYDDDSYMLRVTP